MVLYRQQCHLLQQLIMWRAALLSPAAPVAPGPATATSSAANAPLAVVTPGDKDQQQPTLQHHIDRVKGLRQTMLDACKDMLLAVQRAHTVFGWKYAGPKAEATFVPRAEFETLNFPALLLVDVTTEEEIDAAYAAQDAHGAYYDAVNRVAAAASQLSSAAKLQSTSYTDSERAEAEDVLDACQPAIDDVNYSESFAGSGMLASWNFTQ